MTRLELLHLLLGQARSNGFHLRRWYVGWLGLPWEGSQKATETLCEGRRYYALLFSRDFACSFWKGGEQMTLQVSPQTFHRAMPDGTVAEVRRKGFTRRVSRPDAWIYHIRQMAAAEDPLRYIRRFLRVEEELEPEAGGSSRVLGLQQGGDPRFIVDEEDLLTDEDP